jgi:putative ABC transport system permease protein
MGAMIRIAIKAVRHGWLSNGFSAVALAAVLAPLLILYGLKLGIVTALLDQLRSDPNIRRVGVSGYQPLTDADIETIRALPQTGFVVGAPRSIAARVEMRREPSAMKVLTADWLPSAEGDPLLAGRETAPLTQDGIILSEPVAEKLNAKISDTILAAVYRNNQNETYELTQTVVDILPRHLLSGDRALVTVERLNALAAFSDGFEVPEAGINGRPATGRQERYDSVRLYARSIDDVTALERSVSAAYGFRTSSEASSIQWVRDLEKIMGGVFLIIAAAGGSGYVISLWATIASSVRNSRGQLSLLRLIGVRRHSLWLFPLVQVLAISMGGLVTAFLFAFAAGAIMNDLYLPDMFKGHIFMMRPVDVLATVLFTLAIAIIVALWQLGTLRRISPTEALAEGMSS